MSLYINPTLVPTAFLLSSTIFVSFTLAALFTQRAQFLFLGGILGSGLSLMLMLSLANLFFRSNLIFQVGEVGLMLGWFGWRSGGAENPWLFWVSARAWLVLGQEHS